MDGHAPILTREARRVKCFGMAGWIIPLIDFSPPPPLREEWARGEAVQSLAFRGHDPFNFKPPSNNRAPPRLLIAL
jgi:hypothetical protein